MNAEEEALETLLSVVRAGHPMAGVSGVERRAVPSSRNVGGFEIG